MRHHALQLRAFQFLHNAFGQRNGGVLRVPPRGKGVQRIVINNIHPRHGQTGRYAKVFHQAVYFRLVLFMYFYGARPAQKHMVAGEIRNYNPQYRRQPHPGQHLQGQAVGALYGRAFAAVIGAAGLVIGVIRRYIGLTDGQMAVAQQKNISQQGKSYRKKQNKQPGTPLVLRNKIICGGHGSL